MANPLQILAGLTTVGSQGAQGALTGQFEGQEVARKRATEDQQNQFRALQAIMEGKKIQQMGQPDVQIQGGFKVTRAFPNGPIISMDPMPTTDLERQRLATSQKQEKFYESQIASKEQPKEPTPQVVLGRIENKVATEGEGALSPGEKLIFDRAKKEKSVQNLELPVRTQLLAQGIQPEAATPEQVRTAAQAVDKRLENRNLITFQGRTDIGGREFDRRTDVRSQIKEKETERKQAFLALTKEQQRAATIADLEQLKMQAKGIDDAGLLPPTGATGLGVWWATKKREWMDPTNQSLIDFRGMFGEIMIGEVARQMYDDKGIRAMQAFKQQFDMIDKLPSYAAISSLFNELEASIKRRSVISGGGKPGAVGAAPAGATPGVVKWGRDAQGNPVPLK